MRIFVVLSIALASCGGLADPLVEPTDAGSAAEARQVVEAAACPGDQIACTLERDEAGAEFAVLGEGGSCCYPP